MPSSSNSKSNSHSQDQPVSALRQKVLLAQITATIALVVGAGSAMVSLSFALNNAEFGDKTNARISNLQQNIDELKKSDIASTGVEYKGETGKTALDVLVGKYAVETEDFGSLGKMVTSIQGVAAGDGQFWAFYVNDEIASEGASTYQTSDEETIQWRLETIQ